MRALVRLLHARDDRRGRQVTTATYARGRATPAQYPLTQQHTTRAPHYPPTTTNKTRTSTCRQADQCDTQAQSRPCRLRLLLGGFPARVRVVHPRGGRQDRRSARLHRGARAAASRVQQIRHTQHTRTPTAPTRGRVSYATHPTRAPRVPSRLDTTHTRRREHHRRGLARYRAQACARRSAQQQADPARQCLRRRVCTVRLRVVILTGAGEPDH
jgi:hypothetical protein